MYIGQFPEGTLQSNMMIISASGNFGYLDEGNTIFHDCRMLGFNIHPGRYRCYRIIIKVNYDDYE